MNPDDYDDAALIKFTKNDLITMIRSLSAAKAELSNKVHDLTVDVQSLKENVAGLMNARSEPTPSYTPDKVLERLEEVERRLAATEQYQRRECIEIVGLSNDIGNEDLDQAVVNVLKKIGVNVSTRDFHAVHRLYNSSTVIAKAVNRRDVTDIFKKKKVLSNLTNADKEELKIDKKVYINESLCPTYRRLFGKCVGLYKLGKIAAFYTINGKIIINTGGLRNGQNKIVGGTNHHIGHMKDLENLFTAELVSSVRKST